MVASDKGKAKALATASTLQKVVCPAPERDPQEILSNGWRKVGEQKKITNRLANGHPDRGLSVSSPDSSSSLGEPPGGSSTRTNGRHVLDRMFGHLRPHHILAASAVLRSEEQEELANRALGSQAARLAYFRPSIGMALNELPSLPSNPQPSTDGAAVNGATAGASPRAGDEGGAGDLSVLDLTAGDGVFGPDVALQQSLSSPCGSPGPSHYHHQHHHHCQQSAAAAAGPVAAARRNAVAAQRLARAGSLGSGQNSPTTMANRVASPRAVHAFGVSGGVVYERRGGLPAVARSCPSDGGAVAGAPGSYTEGTRLPAAFGASGVGGGGVVPGRRRASVSGDTPLPAICAGGANYPVALPGGAQAAATAASGGICNKGNRRRRTSLTLSGDAPPTDTGVGAACSPAAAVLQSHAHGAPRRRSFTGCGDSATSPHPTRMSNSGGPTAGGAGTGASGVLSAANSPVRILGTRAAASGGSRCGSCCGSPAIATVGRAAHSTGSGGHAPQFSKLSPAGGGGNGGGGSSFNSRSGTGSGDAPPPLSTLAHVLGDLQGPGAGGGGGAVGAAGAGAPAVNPAVPLSGLQNLAGTGLADAISQLRNIRMGGGAGGGGGGSGGGGAGSAKEAKERKPEPGLAGFTPLQLLPVPLPPLDNWQAGGKGVSELDPCKGIRLVDTANCVLPRPMAEACLRVKMAQHQAAMRHLIKAEGPPMSEKEMEAVQLLVRLERSGARHRNFDTMRDDEEGELEPA